MYQSYTLVLVSLNPDHTDAGGNLYPESGEIVCEGFQPNTKITSGLYGTKGGKFTENPYCSVEPGDPWRVIRIEANQDVIIISKEYNLIKFRAGTVICSGNLQECAKYVSDHLREDPEVDMEVSSIAGSKIKTDSNAFHNGFGGEAHTSGAGRLAITTGANAHSIAEGKHSQESHALAFGNKGRAFSAQDHSHAVALKPGSRARCCGESAISISTGIRSTSISSGNKGISATLATDCQAAAGPDGILIMSWMSDEKLRVKVGYVGEEIEPNVLYRVENDEFIKCG